VGEGEWAREANAGREIGEEGGGRGEMKREMKGEAKEVEGERRRRGRGGSGGKVMWKRGCTRWVQGGTGRAPVEQKGKRIERKIVLGIIL
jgi:hypothetical protein